MTNEEVNATSEAQGNETITDQAEPTPGVESAPNTESTPNAESAPTPEPTPLVQSSNPPTMPTATFTFGVNDQKVEIKASLEDDGEGNILPNVEYTIEGNDTELPNSDATAESDIPPQNSQEAQQEQTDNNNNANDNNANNENNKENDDL